MSKELIAAWDPFHHVVEELRAVRTQLLIRWFNPGAGRRTLAQGGLGQCFGPAHPGQEDVGLSPHHALRPAGGAAGAGKVAIVGL